MKHEDLLQYYDYLTKLALSKCGSQTDADDLVSETMLAALEYLHKGRKIEYPKTWLANTLFHKYNSNLRKRYRRPVTVCIEDMSEVLSDNYDTDYTENDEAADLRREINFLAYVTREVLIRYYFGNNSISDIANQLGIPEGTVKSRLSAGRSQIKKGLEKMDDKANYLPGRLNLSWGGTDGPNNEPMCLVENDLIAQNILILAYEKPLTLPELSRMIGIPAAYVEPIARKLVGGELMIHTEGDKYYTDFIVYKPQDSLARLDAQLEFVHKYFEKVWSIMTDMTMQIGNLDYCRTLNTHQVEKLERYCILKALQNFQLLGIDDEKLHVYPNRRDGGHWIAMGWEVPAGYNSDNNEAFKYTVCGGHRTNGNKCNCGGAEYLQLCEFDTTLWDSPHRFSVCGYNNYFRYIRTLLWYIYKDLPLEKSDIPNNMIESIPRFEEVGLLRTDNGKVYVDIPVMSRKVYKQVNDYINVAYNALIAEIGDDYRSYLRGNMLSVPSHINSISKVYRYKPATDYIVMATVREAYEKGLHLRGVDYCCPPVVLVYDE